MFLRRLTSVAVVLALSLWPAVSRAADPYPIDVILSITGGGAFLGTSEQKMLIALENSVNKDGGIQGRPLTFTFYDDQTNPAISVQLATAAIAKKPVVVFGSSLSGMSRATMPLFVNGPVNYSFSPVISPPAGGYVFAPSIADMSSVMATIRYFRGKGWTHIGALTTNDASGQIAEADIATAMKLPENKTMVLVADEHFAGSDTSIAAQAAKIKAAAPQAMMVWSAGTALGTALHGFADIGIDVPVATTSANMNVDQLKQYAAFLPKNLYFQGMQYVSGSQPAPTANKKELQSFISAMNGAGIPIDFQAGLPWDPVMIVIDGLRKIGPNATAEQLHTYIETLKYNGIAGAYDFRDGSQRGLTVNNVNIMRWDAAGLRFVQVSKYGGLPL